MSKKNKIILIILLPLIVELIISCCDCSSEKSSNYAYTNCDLSINNLDNSGASPIATKSNSIPKNAYGIRLLVSRKENNCEIKKSNSLFIQSAYAYSCQCVPEFQYLPIDEIVSITITTLNNFNFEYLANADISDLFYVLKKDEFFNINEYIENLETTLYDSLNTTLELDLLLMSSPSLGTKHQFEVKVELSDGRILNDQTETIELI